MQFGWLIEGPFSITCSKYRDFYVLRFLFPLRIKLVWKISRIHMEFHVVTSPPPSSQPWARNTWTTPNIPNCNFIFIIHFVHPLVIKMLQTDTVFDIFKPIYWIIKIFGYFPFSLNFRNRTVKVNILYVAQLLLTIAVWSLLLLPRFFVRSMLMEKTSSISVIGGAFAVLIAILDNIAIILTNFFNRRKLLKILESLDKFDQKVFSWNCCGNQFNVFNFLDQSSWCVHQLSTAISVHCCNLFSSCNIFSRGFPVIVCIDKNLRIYLWILRSTLGEFPVDNATVLDDLRHILLLAGDGHLHKIRVD